MSAHPEHRAVTPPLRVVKCAECEQLRRALDAAMLDLDNANVDLAAKRRQITRLLNENERDLRNHDDFATAEVIFEFWRKHCAPKARTFGPDRIRPVLDRLNDRLPDTEEKAYTPRYICESVLGAKVDPYIKDGKRHNDLELICRTGRKLEDFHDRYERWKQRTS